MATPLVLKGNLRIGGSPTGTFTGSADIACLTDVTDEVTAFKITGTADTVEIPATLGVGKRNKGGAADYAIEIGYLSSDGTEGLVFDLLYNAIDTPSKELWFAGSMRDDAISVTNPLWYGKFIVTAAEVGGEAEALSTSAGTFPLTGAPTQDTTP